MVTIPIEEKKQNIQKLLREKRLAEAFSLLRQIIAETSSWQLSDKIDELEQSYKYMIRYVAEGIDDPKRSEIYNGIVEKAFELCDIATTELIARTSPKLYYSTLRLERMHPEDTGLLLQRYRKATGKIAVFDELPAPEKDEAQLMTLLREKESLETAVFKRIWVTFPLPHEEMAAVRDALADPECPPSLREIIMAAIMMSLLEHYCEPMLLTLMDIYTNPASDSRLQIKSLCCALIVMHRYRHVIAGSRQIGLRVADWADNRRARTDIMNVFLQFIRSRGTERISRKMQEELVPKLMKLSPEIRRKLRGTSLTDDLDNPEQNPDWQELLDKSGISEKMLELNRMQMEGSDVFLSSFSHLKSFPFFGNIANWFLPFDARHSSVRPTFDDRLRPLLSMVDRSGVFCDSDKYSFALSVAGVPPQQREMMLGQFDEQQAQMMENESASLPDPDKERDNIANKYVQNLYRFFNLFSRKSEFYNPFLSQLNLTEVPFVDGILSDTENLRLIAEFYFKQEHYADALVIFRKITEKEPPTASTCQKIGFCHEMLKQYDQAVGNFEKAELLKSGDLWTLKHLAFCHRAAGNVGKAIDCYRRAESLAPDNAAIANNLGNCLLEAGRTADALKCYFKADYLAQKGARTLRPVAWCSFLTGDYAQSTDYYNRIIALSPSLDDYVNRGHALLCGGKVKEAVESYLAPLDSPEAGKRIAECIESDRKLLEEAGIDSTLVSVLLDKIRYQVSGMK